jgi:hypothetical protein
MLYTTPWCKDCWFIDTCHNLVRCEYHHSLWLARYRKYTSKDIRRRQFYIRELPENEVDKTVSQKETKDAICS